jgi:hypothetical protein
MKKFLIGLLIGLLVGSGVFYLFSRFMEIPVLTETPVESSSLIVDGCGNDLFDYSGLEWFDDLISATDEEGLVLSPVEVADVCYFGKENALVFLYVGENPYYSPLTEGIYKYDVNSGSLSKSSYADSNGEMGSHYNLPLKFEGIMEGKILFSARPIAWGCGDIDTEPCYSPGATHYEYDVEENMVMFVEQDPSELVPM